MDEEQIHNPVEMPGVNGIDEPAATGEDVVASSQEPGADVAAYDIEAAAAEQVRTQLRLDSEFTHGAARQQRPPSVGRIVHFVDRNGKHLAAIVTGIPLGSESDADLHVLPHHTAYRGEWASAQNHAAVDYDDSGKPHTWHWPERE